MLDKKSFLGSQDGHDHRQEEDDMVSYWTDESIFESSAVSAYTMVDEGNNEDAEMYADDDKTALKDKCYGASDVESCEESIKSISEGRNTRAIRRSQVVVNRDRLRRTKGVMREGGDMDGTVHTMMDASAGEASFISIEETIDDFEDYLVDSISKDTELRTERDELTEDDHIICDHHDDEKSCDAFSLQLPTLEGPRCGNYDSVSEISFTFDDLGDSDLFSTDCRPYVIMNEVGNDSAVSSMTRESISTSATPTISASIISEIEQIKAIQPLLSYSMRTPTTAVSKIVSSAAFFTKNPPIAPATNNNDIEKNNSIISNMIQNINRNRKKSDKSIGISRSFLLPLKDGEGKSIKQNDFFNPIHQRRKEQIFERKRNDVFRHESLVNDQDDQSPTCTNDFDNNIPLKDCTRALRVLELGGSRPRVVLSRTNNSPVHQTGKNDLGLLQNMQLEDSIRSIVTDVSSGSQRTCRNLFGRLQKVQFEHFDKSLSALSASQSSSIISHSFSSIGLSRSESADSLSRSSNSGNRLSRSGSSNSLSRCGSSGRLSHSSSGNRLDRSSSFGTQRMLRDSSDRTASGSSGRRIMVGRTSGDANRLIERVHASPLLGGSSRKMIARVNSAKKLILYDQRQTGSSRTGIFKIEEGKDLLSATRSTH